MVVSDRNLQTSRGPLCSGARLVSMVLNLIKSSQMNDHVFVFAPHAGWTTCTRSARIFERSRPLSWNPWVSWHVNAWELTLRRMNCWLYACKQNGWHATCQDSNHKKSDHAPKKKPLSRTFSEFFWDYEFKSYESYEQRDMMSWTFIFFHWFCRSFLSETNLTLSHHVRLSTIHLQRALALE